MAKRLTVRITVNREISVADELRKYSAEIVAIRRRYHPMRFANWFYSWRMVAATACIFAGGLIALAGTRLHSATLLLAGMSLFAVSYIGFACCSLYASGEIVYQGILPCGGRDALANDIELAKLRSRERMKAAEPDRRRVAVYERSRWRGYADCVLSWIVNGTGFAFASSFFGRADLALLVVNFYHTRAAAAEVCAAVLIITIALVIIVRSRFDEELDILRFDTAA